MTTNRSTDLPVSVRSSAQLAGENRARTDHRLGRQKQRPGLLLLGMARFELRRFVGETLRADGHEVRDAGDGIDMLEMIADSLLTEPQGRLPDLVIAECGLPGRRGIDLLADLRTAGWASPFMLIAERQDRPTIEAARFFRHVVIFEIPFDIDDLRTAVVLLLARCPEVALRRVPIRRAWERRTSKRFPSDIWLEDFTGSVPQMAHCSNISVEGLLVDRGPPYPKGMLVNQRFHLVGEPSTVQLRSQVVRVAPPNQGEGCCMGLRFVDITQFKRKEIERMILATRGG